MNLNGYITVAERLSRALEKWPELRVTEAPPRIITIGDSTYIEVTTIIYRSPDDPMPTQASCWEPWPGKTPFTRDSEQPNASTSALGRCLGLMGVAVDKALASADEVENRKQDSAGPPAKTQLGSRAKTAPSKAAQAALDRGRGADTEDGLAAVLDAFPGATEKRRQEPTPKMVGFYKKLCAERGRNPEEDALHDFDACKRAIDQLKAEPRD